MKEEEGVEVEKADQVMKVITFGRQKEVGMGV